MYAISRIRQVSRLRVATVLGGAFGDRKDFHAFMFCRIADPPAAPLPDGAKTYPR
jgi:hypothetical protein